MGGAPVSRPDISESIFGINSRVLSQTLFQNPLPDPLPNRVSAYVSESVFPSLLLQNPSSEPVFPRPFSEYVSEAASKRSMFFFRIYPTGTMDNFGVIGQLKLPLQSTRWGFARSSRPNQGEPVATPFPNLFPNPFPNTFPN